MSVSPSPAGANLGTVTWTTDNSNIATVSAQNDSSKATVTAVDPGTTNITASVSGSVSAVKCTVTVTDGATLTVTKEQTPSSLTKLDYDESVTLKAVATVKDSAGTNVTSSSYDLAYEWKKDSVKVKEDTNEYKFYAEDCTVSCTVTATPKSGTSGETKKETVSWTVTVDTNLKVYATVSGSYFLGDLDDASNARYTVWEKIENELDLGRNDYLEYVEFDNRTTDYGDLDVSTGHEYEQDEFNGIEFTPESKGDAKFYFTAHVNDDSRYGYDEKGVLIIEVKDTASSSKGDITYTAELGEDFYFDISDFEDYFDDKFSSGSLDYVIFNSASNGKVKDGRSTVDYDKDKYYVDPGRNDNDLADVYFSPNSSSKAMTGKVNFTVYGTKSQSREGTIVIYYLNDSASDITYSTTGGKVTLDPKDFEDAYKEATGSKTAPSGLTIEFQNVPTNGTLTYTGGSRDKDLTKSNVKSNRYTTKSSGSYRLAQLTYSGTKGTDTIDYIAYSGGTAQFSGKVVFNGAPAVPTDVVVGPFYSTAGQPAAFNLNTFTAASSAISNAVKVRFVAPANGTLTMSGASAAGIDVATSLLNLVSYQPKAGYNGTDQIIFAAYDAKNAVVASGTVNVQVIGNPTTTTPSTPGGSTGVTDVSQFKDVASGAWYRDNLATLVKKGVISGKGEGKFDPKGTVTYGEALKMVLQACGYSAVAGTGSQWAINYKNLAVSRGWISNDIDLNAAISRNATAELAAKVLGVSPVTSGSPFADDANAYAVALYYTTPQIFVGTTNPNGGKPLFENNKPLLREQVCAVICRVMDYHTQHTTNTMPDGI